MVYELEKTNAHKRDSHIVFEEEGHKYYIDGDDNYMSATTFIHKVFPEFDTDRIIAGIKKRNTPKYIGMSYQEIKDLWEENKNKAAVEGTRMHYNIELESNNQPVDDDTIEYKHYLKFRKDYPYLIPYRTEWTIYDKKYRIAGSIDMIYLDIRDGTYHIYDWKRSKQLWAQAYFDDDVGYPPLDHLPNTNLWHYHLQLNLYKHILEKNYGIKIKTLYLCRCHPDNKSYHLVKGVDLSKEIKEILTIRKEQVKQNIFDFPINLIKKESTDNEKKTINEKDCVDYEKELVIPKGKCIIDDH